MAKTKRFISDSAYADMIYYFATTCPSQEQYHEAVKRLKRYYRIPS